MHKIVKFCVTSSLAPNNLEQQYCQTLGNKPNEDDYFPNGKFKLFNNLFTQRTFFFSKKFLFYCPFVFPVRYLCVVCNEDKCCVVTQCTAYFHVEWMVYVCTYCVPIATLNKIKRTRLLYLGDAQIIN